MRSSTLLLSENDIFHKIRTQCASDWKRTANAAVGGFLGAATTCSIGGWAGVTPLTWKFIGACALLGGIGASIVDLYNQCTSSCSGFSSSGSNSNDPCREHYGDDKYDDGQHDSGKQLDGDNENNNNQDTGLKSTKSNKPKKGGGTFFNPAAEDCVKFAIPPKKSSSYDACKRWTNNPRYCINGYSNSVTISPRIHPDMLLGIKRRIQ